MKAHEREKKRTSDKNDQSEEDIEPDEDDDSDAEKMLLVDLVAHEQFLMKFL